MYKMIRFDTINSTNDYAKTLVSSGQDAVIVAHEQTKGKGTKGRSFSSQTGGIYFTKLTFYKNFSSKNAFLIMSSAATAVCKTLESFGFLPTIKWANDVLVNDRKICGILIENAFCGENIAYSIVGIGLNVNNLLPREIHSIATTMREEGKKEYLLSEVEEKLIKNSEKIYSLKEYKKRLGFLHKQIVICKNAVPVEDDKGKAEKNEKFFIGSFEGITDRGELIAMVNGKKEIFSAAEISFRERK